jgi:hypothetical protein
VDYEKITEIEMLLAQARLGEETAGRKMLARKQVAGPPALTPLSASL